MFAAIAQDHVSGLAFARPRTPVRVVTVATSSDEAWAGLMAAAQRGEAAPYRRLLAELRPWLVRYFSRRLPSAQIDDAVQDTLIAIHSKRHTFEPERPFGPWLAGIARYKWIDRLRSLSRHAADELPETLATGDHENAVTSAIVLQGLLAMLKPAQAEAIRLVKIDGLSIEEAAARTGQSESLVKVIFHLGLGRLARLVEAQADAD